MFCNGSYSVVDGDAVFLGRNCLSPQPKFDAVAKKWMDIQEESSGLVASLYA